MRHRVLVPGTFDVLHYGHMRFLAECAKLGSVIVALATDAHAHPKRKPIMNYDERKEMLFHLPYVDEVIPKDSMPLIPIILKTKAHIVCYGSDWAKDEWHRMNGLFHDNMWLVYTVEFIVIDNPMVISTTEIIARIYSNSIGHRRRNISKSRP